ncbi:alpha/beta fold hydrolase [Streptomyces sp. NPDC057620]|uniref:esterase/lipase family protein n=1 Tax=Streptomyces sp. NPDC057620 TaxID=3346185 RepID=UPI0036957126
MTDDWTSLHDITGPALALLCPVPADALPRGVRNPRDAGRGVVAEGMALEVPFAQHLFEEKFWNGLPYRLGPDAFVMPERPAPAEVHSSGWTRTVTAAAAFFGLQGAHVPCLVVLSMREKHGTVIPVDESFDVAKFLRALTDRMGLAPATLGQRLDEREQLRCRIGQYQTGLEPAQTQALSRRLAEAEVLAPELIADCRARVESLAQAEPSDTDLRVLHEVAALLRSPERQADRHNLRIGGLLSRLERVIGTLETQRPTWEERRQSREKLATVEEAITALRDKVAHIRLTELVTQVAAELPRPLNKVATFAADQLPGWSFSRLGHTAAVRASAERAGALALVMVHGFRSSGAMWTPLQNLLKEDPELNITSMAFEYATGLFEPNPTRVFPSINVVADSLMEYLRTEAKDYGRLVILAHSQGGLIVQRYLTRMLAAGRGNELPDIRRVVLLACPNTGSQIFLPLRRAVMGKKHPQESELRPLNEEVTNTRRALMRHVIHATAVSQHTRPIPFSVYAGESDNIVPAAAAQDVYPDVAVLPGDHSSIARPTSLEHRTYTTLRRLILAECQA